MHVKKPRLFQFFVLLLSTFLLSDPALAQTEISGPISTDTTWSDPVYHVTGNISVDAGVTLTIVPGTVIKFPCTNPSAFGSPLEINGTLNATGTELSRIFFTDIRDDSVGGDSNGDGAATSPEPGCWRGIDILDGGSAVLDYVEVRYGGQYKGYYYNSRNANIYKTGTGSLTLTHSIVRDSSRHGVYVSTTSTALAIEDNTIENNGSDGSFHGLYLVDASEAISIARNYIATNTDNGLLAESSSLSIADNEIDANGGNGVQISDSDPAITGNQLHDNGGYGLYLTGDSQQSGVEMNLFHSNTSGPIRLIDNATGTVISANNVFGGPVHVSGYLSVDTLWSNTHVLFVADTIWVQAGAALTISEATVVKFDYGKFLNVHGHLNATGTVDDPIHFTDIRDDSAGGDSNGDGDDTTPGVPWWQGIYIRAGGSAILDRVEVRYAGRYYQYYEPGAIHKTGAGLLVVTDSSILHSDRRAIVLKGTDEDHAITKNVIDGVAQGDAIYLRDASGAVTVADNLIASSHDHGIRARDDSRAVITGNTIRDSGHSGIFLSALSLETLISGNLIEGNASHGIYAKDVSAALTITENTVRSNGQGLYLVRNSPTVSRNTISGNGSRGIYVAGIESTPDILGNHIYANDIGILCVSSANPLIGGSLDYANDIHSNTTYGVQNTADSVTVNARYNWWGNASGPYHPATNADGLGNEVSNWVDYGDFLDNATLDRIFHDRFGS